VTYSVGIILASVGIILTLVRTIPTLLEMVPTSVGELYIPSLQRDASRCLTPCVMCRNISYKLQQCRNIANKFLQNFSIKLYTHVETMLLAQVQNPFQHFYPKIMISYYALIWIIYSKIRSIDTEADSDFGPKKHYKAFLELAPGCEGAVSVV